MSPNYELTPAEDALRNGDVDYCGYLYAQTLASGLRITPRELAEARDDWLNGELPDEVMSAIEALAAGIN